MAESGQRVGVVVASFDQTHGGKVLEIHAMKCEPGSGYAAAADRELEQIARQSGCVAMRFTSPRRGWERLMPSYEARYVTYLKALA